MLVFHGPHLDADTDGPDQNITSIGKSRSP